MTAKVERIAGPLRAEVSALSRELQCGADELRQVQAPRVSRLGYQLDHSEVPLRAAWWLMGQWLLGYSSGVLEGESTLEEAESWFCGAAATSLPALAPRGRSVAGFSDVATQADVAALLPYLLDPLGPGTRRYVLSSELHQADRQARKATGVYYTPADVARYMAASVAPHTGGWACWDPACGSGVFLRAALTHANPASRVFGCDIDPMAAEMAAFVVVASRTADVSLAPWFRWHQARIDLTTRDALCLSAGTELGKAGQRDRAQEVACAASRLASGIVEMPSDELVPLERLGSLFPALENGADVLLSNPPYAKLGRRTGISDIGQRFVSLASATPASNMYTAFVEMAWHHTQAERGAAAVVVPLSVAFHTDYQYRSLRRGMENAGGAWHCSFFDRTPDALFGDDVKTRNSVLTYRAGVNVPASVSVTGLARWTSARRQELFSSLRHTAVHTSIQDRVPKIGSHGEGKLYAAVRGLPGYLNEAIIHQAKVPAAAITSDQWPHTLFVGPTAYNWFNCLRDVPPGLLEAHDSKSALTALQFADDATADIAYALVASRVVFWLWRIESDAFHLSPVWLSALNFRIGSLRGHDKARLARLGRQLWEAAVTTPVHAVNKGMRTVAFPATLHLETLVAVDETVLNSFGLRDASTDFDLDAWYRATVVVDRTNNRRLSMAPGNARTC